VWRRRPRTWIAHRTGTGQGTYWGGGQRASIGRRRHQACAPGRRRAGRGILTRLVEQIGDGAHPRTECLYPASRRCKRLEGFEFLYERDVARQPHPGVPGKTLTQEVALFKHVVSRASTDPSRPRRPATHRSTSFEIGWGHHLDSLASHAIAAATTAQRSDGMVDTCTRAARPCCEGSSARCTISNAAIRL